MFKGGTNTSALTQPHGINVSTTLYGKTVKAGYGIHLVSPDLVWVNDWEEADHPSNATLQNVLGTSGKKKTSKKSGIKFFSAALDLLLEHSPCRGVLSVYYNNTKFAVVPCSSSGFVSGGAFSFTPQSTKSTTTITGTIPGTPFQVTAPNFVSDMNEVKANGVQLQPATFPPGAGQYSVSSGGVYTFNAAQSGDSYSIQYRATTSGSPGTLAAIYAVTVAESFTETFNDYGGPGSITVVGTWDHPLWNESFPVPGRIDAGAYTARRPYSFNWNGSSPTVNVPAALNGLPITVYYGVPAIFKSDGTFFSDTITPLQLLNLEFEQEFASGSEYGAHTDQQIIQPWCAGLGSVRFDLGSANAMPNLNCETIGAFTQWSSGDADVADVITDIITSGPVLP